MPKSTKYHHTLRNLYTFITRTKNHGAFDDRYADQLETVIQALKTFKVAARDDNYEPDAVVARYLQTELTVDGVERLLYDMNDNPTFKQLFARTYPGMVPEFDQTDLGPGEGQLGGAINKRRSKSRVSKKRKSKSRVSKKRRSKPRVSKKRKSKSRVSKKRKSKSRVSKKRKSKSRVSKKRKSRGRK